MTPDRFRRRPRFILWVFGALALVLLAVIVWLVVPGPTAAYSRQTIVIATDPITVASWNPDTKVFTTITFPQDVVTEGTHGYGSYSFAAFWRLGQIDKKNGTVLSESMSEALGLPVEWYIGPATGAIPTVKNGLDAAKRTFSLGNLLSFLGGHFRTNIPLRSFLSLSWVLTATKPDRVDTFDFTGNPTLVAQDVTLPDGSHQMVLDTNRLDAQMKNIFEDDRIRQESISVAVYNTTDLSSLGTRVARLLGHVGVNVIFVGNDSPKVDACSVRGSEAATRSWSARVIVAILGCAVSSTTEPGRADLILHIGGSYAKRFAPQ